MENHHSKAAHGGMRHYRNFLIMTIISFVAMYILMYAMVDTFANVLTNVNQIYMVALMTAAMVLIEIFVMRGMYTNKKYNAIIMTSGVILLGGSFFAIRAQTAVSDRQFLKSMVPHHAAAILMVKEAKIEDPDIRQLAADIIAAQQKEIDFMKAKLKAIDEK